MKTAEDSIRILADGLRAKGHRIPDRISQIEDFPYRDFDQFQQALGSGEFLLQQFGLTYSPEIFAMLATRFEEFKSWVFISIMWIGPLMFLVLAFVSSWPWIFGGVAAFVIGFKGGKKNYWRVLFRSAYASEAAFCFLYGIGKICITPSDKSRAIYWEMS